LVDVGCGEGGHLLEFLRIGFKPENLTGLELIETRLATARQRLPQAVHLYCGDALDAPIEPASQDLVFQSVVFSSLLDDSFQDRLAEAMWHWLKPGGAILWYDFVYDNPNNPDVRGVTARRIREMFPNGSLHLQRLTLAPPIARRVTAVHPMLYNVLNAVPLLRTHLLCWIAKPVIPPSR
jgi:SAM-dependent methyltransferase